MNVCFQKSDILTLKFDSAFMLLNTMSLYTTGLSGIVKKYSRSFLPFTGTTFLLCNLAWNRNVA